MSSDVEGAVERLTAFLAETEKLGLSFSEAYLASYGPGGRVVLSADLRALLASHAALTERVRELEGERDDTIVRWCARMAEIREASGVGVKPMLAEVPGAIAERFAAAEARAEAAERRAGELAREVAKLRRILSTPATEA